MSTYKISSWPSRVIAELAPPVLFRLGTLSHEQVAAAYAEGGRSMDSQVVADRCE
jgi:hypothetical protein